MNEFRHAATRVPGPLRPFPWGAPDSFLGLPPEQTDFGSARVVLLPVPLHVFRALWVTPYYTPPSGLSSDHKPST